jgi:hypothetical protein
MSHPRTRIRAAIVTRLGENLSIGAALPDGVAAWVPAVQGFAMNDVGVFRTLAGPRVFSGRLMPIEEPELPAIVVHTREPEEIISRSASGWNGFERRRCTVSVVCIAQSFDDLDADLDILAAQVEAALQTFTIPGFESAELNLAETRSEDPEFDGALTTGATQLRYQCVYMTPYRDCSNPYVEADADSIYQSGAYPGGQVIAGCPVGNTGEACPVTEAELFSQQEPIN